MKVGCFALIDPFSVVDHQLERIAGLGFKYADVTDNHSGGLLGNEFGFTGALSLDSDPADVKALFDKHGCGFSPIALGEGVIDVAGVYEILKDGAAEYSTLEVGGDDNMLKSYEYLKSLGAE